MANSSRLGLPFLESGQMGKEITHNEALARLDLAVAAAAISIGDNVPPPDPAEGECHIVGAEPTGDWAGQPLALAGFTSGGWRFVAPVEGMRVAYLPSGGTATFFGGEWAVGIVSASRVEVDGVKVVGVQQAAILEPTGGATVDVQARAVLGEILAALRMHGLIAT